MNSPKPGLTKTLQFHLPFLVTTSHEDLPKAVMYVVHISDTPRAAASRCSVSNRKIIEIAIKLEYVKEERDTPLVESENQQQIYIWFITNPNLPSVQGQTYIE